MQVLVMVGTHHVGRAVVEVSLRRGDIVTPARERLRPSPGRPVPDQCFDPAQQPHVLNLARPHRGT